MTEADAPADPTEMVLKVAKAIIDASPHDDHNFDPVKVARAAIAAMREPTEGMIEAGERINDYLLGSWQAMIDSALGKTEPK